MGRTLKGKVVFLDTGVNEGKRGGITPRITIQLENGRYLQMLEMAGVNESEVTITFNDSHDDIINTGLWKIYSARQST